MEPSQERQNSGHVSQTQPKRIEVQKPSLPKGGGALSGLGESFTSNEFSGTFSMAVPLPVAPCRGAEPHLQLEYESGGGNSLMGLGWSAPLSSIVRRTSRGIPRYDSSDTFMLDGGQLVLDSRSMTKRNANHDTYIIHRYHPHVESGFERIEFCVPQQAGAAEACWRVIHPDSTIHIYGRTSQARICDPNDPARIFEWLLEDVFDARGNRQHYGYKQEAYEVTRSSPGYEKNRVHTANRYLERVCYGNITPAFPVEGGLGNPQKSDWMFETVFDYGEYNLQKDKPYRTDQAWAERSDPFSNWSAGFERRCHRLCRNVLLFHCFPQEPGFGSDPVLTGALRLFYDESPSGALLIRTDEVHCRHDGQQVRTKALPGLEFSYTQFTPRAGEFVTLKTSDNADLNGFNADGFACADLDGQGIASIIYSDGNSVFVREPQLDSLPPHALTYSAWREPLVFPAERDASRLMDIDGDGRPDFFRNQPPAGYYANSAEGWQPFKPFDTFPTDYGYPLNEHADMEGSGRVALAMVEQERVRYYPSLGPAGFGPEVEASRPAGLPLSTDESPDRLVRFADLFGTGGSHRILIESGNITCWPHLGFGKFGQPITLAAPPAWPAGMDASCVFLADLDGSGTPDLVLAEADQVKIYRNQSGNSFAADPLVLPLPFTCHSPEQIQFYDVYGMGADCLVVCDDSAAPRFLCYDFCQGTKPYLLNCISNNMGAETAIAYKSSTFYYLMDKNQGQPWITNLPFPVAVVSHIEKRDLVSKTKNISSFTYHHGHYDPIEREFRGFGRVERSDTEALLPGVACLPHAGTPLTVAPVLSKTWYHSGVGGSTEKRLMEQYQREYFPGDQKSCSLAAVSYEGFADQPDEETMRQASAALHGSMLRQEVYSLDPGSTHGTPEILHEASDHAYVVRLVQPRGDNPYGVFLVYQREAIAYHYEWKFRAEPQSSPDPRVVHEFTLEVDPWGQVLKSCSIGYARRTPEILPEQQEAVGRGHQTLYLDQRDEPDILVRGVVAAEKDLELLKLPSPDIKGMYYSWEAVKSCFNTSGNRLLTWSRYYYRAEGGTETPSAQIAPQVLLLRAEQAEFSPETLKEVFKDLPVAVDLEKVLREQGGYVWDAASGYWWNPGLIQDYFTTNESLFFLPKSTMDPLGAKNYYAYDPYGLFLKSVKIRAAGVLDSETTVEEVDYQALQPVRIRDMNQNIAEILLDVDGLPVASSVHRLDGEPGREGFALLRDYVPVVAPALEDILQHPETYLQGAGSYFFHNLFAWRESRTPCFTVTLSVDRYPAPDAPTRPGGTVHAEIAYSDGFARLVQAKSRVEKGEAFLCDQQGRPILAPDGKSVVQGQSDVRWLSSGGVQYNNKGLPFKKYEPFFISSHQYTDFEYLTKLGVSATLWYDALGRVVRTDFPRGPFGDCGVFEKNEYSSWVDTLYDVNDTIKDSPYYAYVMRQPNSIEKNTMKKTEVCHDTPIAHQFDVRGNVIRELTCGRAKKDQERETLAAARGFDAAGHEIWSADPRLFPRKIKNYQRWYSLAGHELKSVNVDAGTKHALNDILGNPVFTCDSRGTLITFWYDSLRRHVETRVARGNQYTHTTECIIYGDSLDAKGKLPAKCSKERNLYGRIYRHYSPSGLHRISAYTLQGQPVKITERLRMEYRQESDWRADGAATWPDIFRIFKKTLAGKHVTANYYDAFGRILKWKDPSKHWHARIYYLSGHIHQALLDGKAYFTGLDYNAHGQRVKTIQGENIVSEYVYEADTFRLKHAACHASGSKKDWQNLTYYYDPIGHITHITDAAAPMPLVFNRGEKVTPDSDFTYDSLYRLIVSSGRAHAGLTLQDERSGGYQPFFRPAARGPLNDSRNLENYIRLYCYDHGGNLNQMRHLSRAGQWTRTLAVAEGSNRAVYIPPDRGGSAMEHFDANGNQVLLDGLASVAWNYQDNIQSAVLVNHSQGDPDAEYYVYNHAGQRVRKITEIQADGSMQREETLYFGSCELYTQSEGGQKREERWRVRVMDGQECIAEFLEWSIRPRADAPQSQVRWQLCNNIGSAVMELDEQEKVLSYEEYAPYGTTVYAIGASLAQVDRKKYRYSGKERDKQTGLYYYGARYYAPWLCRWLSPDPAGEIDGLNLYAFVGGNPVNQHDIDGLVGGSKTKKKIARKKPHKLLAPPAFIKLKPLKNKKTIKIMKKLIKKAGSSLPPLAAHDVGQEDFDSDSDVDVNSVDLEKHKHVSTTGFSTMPLGELELQSAAKAIQEAYSKNVEGGFGGMFTVAACQAMDNKGRYLNFITTNKKYAPKQAKEEAARRGFTIIRGQESHAEANMYVYLIKHIKNLKYLAHGCDKGMCRMCEALSSDLLGKFTKFVEKFTNEFSPKYHHEFGGTAPLVGKIKALIEKAYEKEGELLPEAKQDVEDLPALSHIGYRIGT